MATTQTISSQYKGALAGDIFIQAFKKSDTISKRCITVLPNVIGSAMLPKLSYSADFTASSCGFDPTGTVGYTEKEVATKKFKVQHELCKEEFHQTFAAQALNLFGADNDIPQTIQEAILSAMISNLGAKLDSQIWNGNNSTDQMAGLLPQFVADATVVDVVGTTVTKANVVAELDKVYNAIPAEVEDDEDLVIAVSKNVAKAYKQAQADMGNNTTVGNKELDYIGVRIESIGGLPTNTMVAYRVKNLGFATNLESDLNEVRVSDDTERQDGNIRTTMKFSAGAGYSFGSEVVYYKPA